MADHLRQPDEYPIVFALIGVDGRVITRIDTGLVARWIHGELVVPLDEDDAMGQMDAVVDTIRREAS